ncbi:MULTISPECIES: hypothetical protein [Streptomyces]|uniref:Uncharacterized protein n=1 Tax=Streptomyces nymphaeiformis TaxID=2663842 RepID=A0A7W7XAK3_9ACTN|nr:hypothetical protein [Streptomyces nymphaeiformis]MBB4981035.1 hypothetical protein [Streptomyces nymphaeiformis]
MNLKAYVKEGRTKSLPPVAGRQDSSHPSVPDWKVPVTGLDATQIWTWAAIAAMSGFGPSPTAFR